LFSGVVVEDLKKQWERKLQHGFSFELKKTKSKIIWWWWRRIIWQAEE
jgi:hypothetical protein